MGEKMYRLYVMKAGKYYKIGISTDPERRVKHLRTGNPHIQLLKCSPPMAKPAALKLERHYHQALRKEHVTREWYELKPWQVRKILGSRAAWQDWAEVFIFTIVAILFTYIIVSGI